MQRYVVKAQAWLEIIVGAILIAAPDVPCMLVFGSKPEAIARPLARWVGLTLCALGVACLPSRNAEPNRSAVIGFFVLNVGVTVLFAWVGFATVHGPVLWPVVILHAVIAVALLPQLMT
jgi:hypothetical protein